VIRVSKLTDYGIILLVHMASKPIGTVFSAKELSVASSVPLPTVSKLLKSLVNSHLISSKLGVNGGYVLAYEPHGISVSRMIEALEGPLLLTDCASQVEHTCVLEKECPTKTPWQKVNQVIHEALGQLTLAQMAENFCNSQDAQVLSKKLYSIGVQ